MNFNLLATCSSDVEERRIGRTERECCYFEKGDVDDLGPSFSAILFGRAEWIGRSSIRTLLTL